MQPWDIRQNATDANDDISAAYEPGFSSHLRLRKLSPGLEISDPNCWDKASSGARSRPWHEPIIHGFISLRAGVPGDRP